MHTLQRVTRGRGKAGCRLDSGRRNRAQNGLNPPGMLRVPLGRMVVQSGGGGVYKGAHAPWLPPPPAVWQLVAAPVYSAAAMCCAPEWAATMEGRITKAGSNSA